MSDLFLNFLLFYSCYHGTRMIIVVNWPTVIITPSILHEGNLAFPLTLHSHKHCIFALHAMHGARVCQVTEMHMRCACPLCPVAEPPGGIGFEVLPPRNPVALRGPLLLLLDAAEQGRRVIFLVSLVLGISGACYRRACGVFVHHWVAPHLWILLCEDKQYTTRTMPPFPGTRQGAGQTPGVCVVCNTQVSRV